VAGPDPKEPAPHGDEIARRQSTGCCWPWDVVAEAEDGIEGVFEGEVEDVLEIGIEFESVPACVAFVASSDSPYLGELTYPWIWSLSILFATTCTG